MVFAWIGTACTGIILAHHFKVVWPNGGWFDVSLSYYTNKSMSTLSLHVVLQAHRGHMISTWILSIIGVIIIFAHAGEWVYVCVNTSHSVDGVTDVLKCGILQSSTNGGVHNAHPIIGLITVLLTTAQPIMAAFRPHPGTPRCSIL